MGALSNVPFLAGYNEQDQINRASENSNLMKLSQLMKMQKMQQDLQQSSSQQDLMNKFASTLPPDQQAAFRVDPKGFMTQRQNKQEIDDYYARQTTQPKPLAENVTGFEKIPLTQPGGKFEGEQGIVGNVEQEIMKIAGDQNIPPADKQAAINQIMMQQKAASTPVTGQTMPYPTSNKFINAFEKQKADIQARRDLQASQQGFTQTVLEANRDRRQEAGIQASGDRQQTSLAAKMAQADLTPEALNNAAENYRITGNLPAMGMGGLAVKAKILNRAAEMAAENGDQAGATVARQVANKANVAALSQVTKQEQMVGAFEKNANMNADLALSLAGAASNTGVPVVTGWVQSGMKNIAGDPAISKFHAATETFINEYAKIMSGSMGNTAISDAARTHAHSLLSTAMEPEQYKGVIGVLKIEMGNRMKGFAQQKQELMGNMGFNGNAQAQQTQGSVPSAATSRAKPSMDEFMSKASAANPGVSGAELQQFYYKKYGGGE